MQIAQSPVFQTELWTGFLLLLRIYTALVVLAKLAALIPVPARLALASALALAGSIAHANSRTLVPLPEELLGGIAAAATETVRGVLLAAPLGIALEMLPTAGRIADVCRGNQMAEQLLPDLSERVSPLELLTAMMACLFCFQTGAAHTLFASLMAEPIAAADLFAAAYQGSSLIALETLLRLSALTIQSGLFIAAPVLAACALLDVLAVGIGRLIPRVAVTSELAALRLVLGILVFAVCAGGGSVEPRFEELCAQLAGAAGGPGDEP